MKNRVIKSYGKINLALNVNGLREDGYHDLDMVMVPIELHDSMLMTELKNTDLNFVTIDDFSSGNIHYNIASSALSLIQSKYNIKTKYRILIHKVLPMQAGVGGGSSNAAFVLKGINQAKKLRLSDDELIELAKKLGSDVPFFIPCKPMRCKDRGTVLEPISIKNNYYVLLVKPKEGCSTKEVFALSDTMELKQCDIDVVIKALADGDDALLAQAMHNSLETVSSTLVPEIMVIKKRLYDMGFTMVSMTGSGSALYALSTNLKEIKKAASLLEDDYQVEVTRILK